MIIVDGLSRELGRDDSCVGRTGPMRAMCASISGPAVRGPSWARTLTESRRTTAAYPSRSLDGTVLAVVHMETMARVQMRATCACTVVGRLVDPASSDIDARRRAIPGPLSR